MQYAPVVFVSAMTKQRIHRLPEVIHYVAEQNAMRISTSVLNQVVEDAIAINPPPTEKGQRLKILYATQVKIKPPTFVIFVNEPEIMHSSSFLPRMIICSGVPSKPKASRNLFSK